MYWCFYDWPFDTVQLTGVMFLSERDHHAYGQVSSYIIILWVPYFSHPTWQVYQCCPCSTQIWGVMLVTLWMEMMEIKILLIGIISHQTPWCSATYSLFYPFSSMSPVKWGLLLVSSQVNIAYISNVLLAHQYFMFMNYAHILILQTPKIVRKGKNTETNKKKPGFL